MASITLMAVSVMIETLVMRIGEPDLRAKLLVQDAIAPSPCWKMWLRSEVFVHRRTWYRSINISFSTLTSARLSLSRSSQPPLSSPPPFLAPQPPSQIH